MVAAEDGSRLLLLPQGGPNVYVYQVEEDSWSIGGALEVLVNKYEAALEKQRKHTYTALFSTIILIIVICIMPSKKFYC